MSYENYSPTSDGATVPPSLDIDSNTGISRQDYGKRFGEMYDELESRDARADLLKSVVGHLTAHAGLDFGKDHVRFATDPEDDYEVEEWSKILARHSTLTVESKVEEFDTGALKTVTIYL